MECFEYLAKISEYIDEELTPSEENLIKSHLLICPKCRDFYQELQVLHWSIQKGVNDVFVPNDLEERVLKALETDRKKIRIQNWITIMILVVVGSLALTFLYPRVLIVMRLLYSLGNAILRSVSTTLSLISPIATLSIACFLIVLTIISLHVVRGLLDDLDSREVLS